MNTLEAAQVLLVSRDAAHKVARVELHDLVALARARVLHVEADRDVAARRLLRRADAKVAVSERGVAQAVAEVVERAVHARLLALPLCVGLRREVVRYLPRGLREGDRELAARVVVAEENVGDGGAALRAGEPGFEYAGDVLVHPVDAHGPPVDEDDDHGLARRVDGLHQLQLPARQFEARAARALADGLRRPVAEDDDRNVRVLRGLDRLAYSVLLLLRQRLRQHFRFGPVRVRDVAALRVSDLHTLAELVLDSFEHRDASDAVRAVAVSRVAVVVGVRADDGDGANLLAQWQDIPVVLQEHEALARGAQGDLAVLRRVDEPFGRVRVFDIRVVEDADRELDAQNVAHAVVERLPRDLPFLDQFAQRKDEVVRRREVGLDVQARLD